MYYSNASDPYKSDYAGFLLIFNMQEKFIYKTSKTYIL